ncbi:spermatogenesis-associated protein 17-like [Anneissia japonica]|uniref:spermatogenesis-associated protein 17-like n=1 Tax=Anneissia japonica TaxID=1529436 RepID=UPI0014257897|nr:spermatogenesis-associated protein 17-like [Anneissia japonica]
MAKIVHLISKTPKIMEQVFARNRKAEEERQQECAAAIKIQAWFRAVRVRAYVKFLHHCATKIQKVWRGCLGRAAFRVMIKKLMMEMQLNFYNAMAVRIQKIWRGYYTRKYIHNYYSRKKYLEGLVIKNEFVRQQLQEYSEQKAAEGERELQQKMKDKLEAEAQKKHYLLSTEVIPGIYNSPFQPYPDEMEYLLRGVKPRPPKGPKLKRDNRSGKIVAASPPLPLTTPLPPIGQKPQGPFRTPDEVLKQRYKPLQPTLRVATSFASVEEARDAMKMKEWVMRVNDNIFLPCTKRHRDYDPLLHTTSAYGHLPYGTKYFRHTDKSQNITTERFHRVVSPIPVFEKLNDNYSKGTETVP